MKKLSFSFWARRFFKKRQQALRQLLERLIFPAPGKPAFVQEGSLVKKGDVLFIIESMKLMNEIKSEFEGRVKKIYIKTGEPVEFGQLIMIIE